MKRLALDHVMLAMQRLDVIAASLGEIVEQTKSLDRELFRLAQRLTK